MPNSEKANQEHQKEKIDRENSISLLMCEIRYLKEKNTQPDDTETTMKYICGLKKKTTVQDDRETLMDEIKYLKQKIRNLHGPNLSEEPINAHDDAEPDTSGIHYEEASLENIDICVNM